jgi:endonuclease YncB( thermonuclease family)
VRSRNNSTIHILGIFFLFTFWQTYAQQIQGKVVGVKDGDTIEILEGNTVHTIRLAFVDCPEKKQPFGTRARQYTSDLCFGREVKALVTGKDRYKTINCDYKALQWLEPKRRAYSRRVCLAL